MSKDTGGPAFPNTVLIDNPAYADLRGMTLRDYFAAKAMQGLIQSPDQVDQPFNSIAQSAYLMAYAMLEVRAKLEERDK